MNKQQNIPSHIAVIMDGNRRWAREHNLPVLEGHRRVADSVLEKLVEHAAMRNISYVTFWAFSTENWTREQEEVTGIMMILKKSIGIFGDRMYKKGVRMQAIGDLSRFDAGIQKSIRAIIEKTKHNSRITVVLALNYGGRDEIIRAVRKLAGQKQTSQITEKLLADNLDTAGIPDPDLLIRTGGEQRLSGFLPWQSRYSELLFVPWYMPDFTPVRLDEAIEEYGRRQRRYGK
jgi:undecaprenyl diphosphate synthase